MKAVGLFSGGLDSTLAIKLITEQEIEVTALHFFSPFCTCNKKGCGFTVKEMVTQLDVDFRAKFLGEEYLSLVKKPKYGYGKNLNPCIDCRILIFKKAKELMHKIKASFVITGEVLGQRPKSQYKRALSIIEKESGLEGLVVRPLSAKLLAPTIPEKKGWINRDKLLDFWGRTRKPQIKLANIFGINNYPCASGGCLLTEPSFCKRVKDLLEYKEFNLRNVELLKVGRHFRITPFFKLIVGRNEGENKKLLKLAHKSDVLLEPKDSKGPIGIGRGKLNNSIKILCSQILAYYVHHSNGKIKVAVKVVGEKKEELTAVERIDEGRLENLRI
jgi:tRNA U34 2-thiouridine synthase MnmA/TrmU